MILDNSLIKKIVAFLIECEGLKTTAYQDSGGVWTIGIGATFYEDGSPVKEGDTVTPQRALALTTELVKSYALLVQSKVKVLVSQWQFIALVSFAFNVGARHFKESLMLKQVNKNPNDKAAITELLPRSFVTASGKPCRGLVNRRMKELKLYFL